MKRTDAFVVFGITGDLARVMTLHSLYRLEARGLLSCPIIGVAVDDWTVEHLREHAHTVIEATGQTIDEAVFARLAARLQYVSGDFTDADTYQRVKAAMGSAQEPVFYLEIPPFLFGQVVKQLHDAGLTENARVVVEKPFGHDSASAHALAAELHQYIDESQLFRIDHFLGKMGLDEILYLRFANAMLQPLVGPQLDLVGADHDGRELRRGGSRSLLRPGGGAARRGGQSHHAGGRGHRHGAALGKGVGHAQRRDAGCVPGDPARRSRPLRTWPVRRVSRHARRGRGVDHRDLRRPAAGHRQLAVVGRAIFHSHRQASADHADGGAAGVPQPAEARVCEAAAQADAGPDRDQARSLDRRADSSWTRCAPTGPGPSRSRSTWSSPTRAARGRRRTRCCCSPPWRGTPSASPVRTASRRRGGSCSR